MTAIVIAGAGHAGIRAALSAREAGFDGKITLIDPDPNMPPYERPPLSKWGGSEIRAVPIVPADRIEAAGLNVVPDEVSAIHPSDHALTLASGRTQTFDKLLLATGARARELAVSDRAPILTLRTKADADAIRVNASCAKSVLIVGAGFIGLELAASLRSIGVAVSVIEQGPGILGRGVSASVARIVQDLHEQNGVQISLGATVTEADIANADLSVAGIGSALNTELAAAARIRVENGILVDQFMTTSAPDIFAAGDCCRCPIRGGEMSPVRLEAWTAAGQQGDIAGRNMVAVTDPEACRIVPWVWSDQYDHVLQVAGLRDRKNTLVERSYAADHHITFGVDSEGKLGFAAGIAPGVKIARDIRIAIKLIEAGADVDPGALADPNLALKTLLRR